MRASEAALGQGVVKCLGYEAATSLCCDRGRYRAEGDRRSTYGCSPSELDSVLLQHRLKIPECRLNSVPNHIACLSERDGRRWCVLKPGCEVAETRPEPSHALPMSLAKAHDVFKRSFGFDLKRLDQSGQERCLLLWEACHWLGYQRRQVRLR